jgi:hypothetical protein
VAVEEGRRQCSADSRIPVQVCRSFSYLFIEESGLSTFGGGGLLNLMARDESNVDLMDYI